MNTRIAAAALTAAALLALTGCNSDDDKSAPSPTPSVDMSSIDAAQGFPPKPDAAHQAIYIAALKAVDPAYDGDPDKAVSEGRNQCQSLNSGAPNADHLAALRLGNDAHPLTDAQGKAINAVLQTTLCPKK